MRHEAAKRSHSAAAPGLDRRSLVIEGERPFVLHYGLASWRAASAVPAQPLTASARVAGAFGRAFAANLYGHLPPAARSELVGEMLRVAAELVVLEQLAASGPFREGAETRQLTDGSEFRMYKCYFTVDRLFEELVPDCDQVGEDGRSRARR